MYMIRVNGLSRLSIKIVTVVNKNDDDGVHYTNYINSNNSNTLRTFYDACELCITVVNRPLSFLESVQMLSCFSML